MDDAATIERCLEGEPDAFRTLVERYQGRALGHAIAITRNRDDAQDAVQDAFLNAHRALHTFDRERIFYSWFYAILRNCCYRLLARRRTDVVDHPVRLDLLESPGVPVDDRLAIERALAELSPSDRIGLTRSSRVPTEASDGQAFARLNRQRATGGKPASLFRDIRPRTRCRRRR